MAKCPICNSRKGKRKCQFEDFFICSFCCGSVRTYESCSDCVYYEKPKRKYNEVPSYSISDMEGNPELEIYGNSIEGSLCAYDVENYGKLRDNDAIRIIELLIDKYYFKDQDIEKENIMVANGAIYVEASINMDLQDVEEEEIVKVLGAIRFVARRRTETGREYMSVIHKYVGQRVGPGIRVPSQ